MDASRSSNAGPARPVRSASMQIAAQSDDDFFFLELGLLRQLLGASMRPRMDDSALGFAWDGSRAVDDFAFMCMLVGNDFLPGMPHLDVADGALNLMLRACRAACAACRLPARLPARLPTAPPPASNAGRHVHRPATDEWLPYGEARAAPARLRDLRARARHAGGRCVRAQAPARGWRRRRRRPLLAS